jgi:hypothetical protein
MDNTGCTVSNVEADFVRITCTWERFPVPKILRMPKQKEHRKPEGRAAPLTSESESANVLPFTQDSQADIDRVAHWVKIADQVLANNGNARKKA